MCLSSFGQLWRLKTYRTWLNNGFLGRTPKAQASKKSKLDYIEMFSLAENTIKEVKRHTREKQENICKSYI